MMASMGPSFPPHAAAGMPQHPGGPGHPMGVPMAHNSSQPGVPAGGMPHQLVPHIAGVSGPGGPMNPAMMGGIPPGAGGPNAHAMSHLNPSGAQMFPNPNINPMAFANNQQLQHQIRQQQQLRQAHLQQQMMQQGGYANMQGMPMGGLGMSMNHMQAQQQAHLAAMRARTAGVPMGHGNPQAHMIAQQVALQQQQQQAAASANNPMAQQGGNPNQPQMNAHQLQNIQQVQLMQNQHMQAQAHAHAQQQAQAQAQAQAQVQGQNQGHPQAAQQPPNQPSQPQQAGQPPQPSPQQAQGPMIAIGTPQMPVQGQTPGPGVQQPNQQQQPGQQQQGPPQAQQQNPVPQVQNPQMQFAAAQQSAMAMMQQRSNMASLANIRGQCVLKLAGFSEHLSAFPGSKGKDDTRYWDSFTQRYFSEQGTFRYTLKVLEGNEEVDKTYDIQYPALARYFHTQFDSGVKSMQFILESTITDRPMEGGYLIENPKASFLYWYESSHVKATGTLRTKFDMQQKIELFEFTTISQEEYISRNVAIEAAKPAHNWTKEWRSLNATDNKQSPEMNKKGKPRPLKSPPNPPPDIDLPQSAVQHGVGVTAAVSQFLEMVEVMNHMNPLFDYFHLHPGVAPYGALEQLVNQASNVNGQNMNGMNVGHPNGNMSATVAMMHTMVNGQQPMQQGGPRTPSFNQFQIGQSPAVAHQMLPGSPHMSSPAPGQMQAPPMQHQLSQQGTSSSGPSANTSPSQSNNKRRRPSGVKGEEDGPTSAPTPNGNAQVNGVQVKKNPPTPRMPKRVKGNPS